MPWIYLCIAGLLEIVWAISLKHTEGFSNLRWSSHGSWNDGELLFSRASSQNYSRRHRLRHLDRHWCRRDSDPWGSDHFWIGGIAPARLYRRNRRWYRRPDANFFVLGRSEQRGT